MKLLKASLCFFLLPALGMAASAANGLNSVGFDQIPEVNVPLPGAPAMVDAALWGLNDLTNEPEPGTGRYGVDPDPYEWVKPEPGYVSPRMRAFESKGVEDSGVPRDMLDRAMRYFDANKANIKNQRYLGIIDFSMHSSR